ncbi:MAG: hypothetical protein Q9162_003869 [Coniocarpon cinnabarinum]
MPRGSGDVSSDYVVLPSIDGAQKGNNATTGASAAGIRALSAQFISFYFRAPIKAFFRTRFDYTGFARAINPHVKANERWSWKVSTPGLLAHAIREHGWAFIPNQVMPPMLANVTVGAILYTSYLQALGAFYEPASRQSKRVFPPPPPSSTMSAGFVAGSVQSIVAAPLDALQARFNTSDLLEGQHRNMWAYAKHKLAEIGPRGILAGWSLSFVKDSIGFAAFFATFETVKSQAYYAFIRRWYGDFRPLVSDLAHLKFRRGEESKPVIQPHYAIEPAFLLAAGISASVTQQAIQHPLSAIQQVHYGRLESLDIAAKTERANRSMLRLYYSAYAETYHQCKQMAAKVGGWRSWLYKDLLWTTLRQTPSTSAGLSKSTK